MLPESGLPSLRFMGRIALALVFVCACQQGSPAAELPSPPPPPPAGWWPPDRGAYVNPIPAENQKPGDPGWAAGTLSDPVGRRLEGFANRVSASPGDSVQVSAHADVARSGSWALYRMGWYGGAGARKVAEGTTAYAAQPVCNGDATLGLVRCDNWKPTFSFTVPKDAVSGLYYVRLSRDDGYVGFVPLVVRDDRQSDLYFQSSVTTYQAYNEYAGQSLYKSRKYSVPGNMAIAVSYDRPYFAFAGRGHMFSWEVPTVRFLERYGYDVSYTTNLDVHREGAQAIVKRGAFLSVGHDEYWSGEERAAVDAARDAGHPLLFLTANPAYWKIRLTDPGADGNPRTITCYKRFPQNDPLKDTVDRTGRFRDAQINNSEEKLVGIAYESWMLFGQSWVADGVGHPIFEGTGLQKGDTIPGIVGNEYDRTFNGGTPTPVSVLASSPVVDAEGVPGTAETTVYRAPSGALVFAAGTIFWAFGLDGAQADLRVQRITANVFKAGLGVPVPAELLTPSPPPASAVDPAWASEVRTVATGMPGPAGVAVLPDGTTLVADARAHRIWKLVGGAAQPFAGDGNPSGDPRFDNVPALQARFFQPTSITTDAAGKAYVADTHNHVIRVVGTDANRSVSTLAGALGAAGYADGPGTQARLSGPMGLSWQDATHLLVADSGNNAIRSVNVATGEVKTIVLSAGGDERDGAAGAAAFSWPTATAATADGRVFFLTSYSGTLKVVGTDPARTVTTLTGGLGFCDGKGHDARAAAQGGLSWDGSGLILSDSGNHRLRRIVPGADAATTKVQTWAGSGKVLGADGSGPNATFGMPLGSFVASDGTVYIADGVGTVRAVRR